MGAWKLRATSACGNSQRFFVPQNDSIFGRWRKRTNPHFLRTEPVWSRSAGALRAASARKKLEVPSRTQDKPSCLRMTGWDDPPLRGRCAPQTPAK